MHNNLPLSTYYVQNIIGAPLYDPHIPPEHLATTEPVTNCLKETVGVENNVYWFFGYKEAGIGRPDCYFLLKDNSIKAISELTEKELRQAHNLQKMYKAGAFNG